MRTSTYRKEVEVPHERGNYFTFKPLTAPQLDEAREVRLRLIAKRAALVKDLSAKCSECNGENDVRSGELRGVTLQLCARCRTRPDYQGFVQDQADDDPLSGRDATTLVKYGLIEWSGPDYNVPCSEEEKADLDKATTDWAAREIAIISEITEGEGRSSERSTGGNGTSEPSPTPSLASGSPS